MIYPLPPHELFRQWILTRNACTIPCDWPRWESHGWHLSAHPDTHVCELFVQPEQQIGWILEPLVYLREEDVSIPGLRFDLPLTGQPTSADIELGLYGRDEKGECNGSGMEGMWIAIIFGSDGDLPFQRVYPGAIHSVMFAGKSKTVATSHNLIENVVRDQELSDAFNLPVREGHYSFGLTAFKGIRRLLPNHYLDLDTFEPKRHWPKGALRVLESGEAGAERIVRHSRRVLDALAQKHRSFKIFLSAGRDSRAVLAIVRPLLTDGTIEVLLSTSVGRDPFTQTDLQAAKELARIAGLHHEIVHSRRNETAAGDILRAFVRLGEAMAGPNLAKPGAIRDSRPDPTFKLAGMAGETGRAYYWAKEKEPLAMTADMLAGKVGAPLIAQVLEAANHWLKCLPDEVQADAADVLDLAYVEQRMGCWEAPARYLFPGRPKVLSPMAAAYNIETMLRLPKDYRRRGDLQGDMVAYGWPELLKVPFNKPRGMLRLIGFQHRARAHLQNILRRWFLY